MRFVCLLPVSSLPCRYRPSACFRRASLRAWARPSAPLREQASSPLREFSFRVPLLFLAFFDFGYKNTAPKGAVKLLKLFFFEVYSIAVIKSKIVVSEKVMFFLVAISYLGYVMLRDYNYQVDLALSLINIAVIIPVYYIVKYGVKCLIEFNNNYFL